MADAAVVWNPAFPAGTAFYQSQKIVFAGPKNYSNPPLMSEVNSGSDTNQIIALTNRRISQIGTGIPISYVNSNDPITKSWIDNLRTQINLLRAANGLSSFTFTNVISGQTKITAAIFTELRTALGQLVGSRAVGEINAIRYQWRQDDLPYGTPIAGFPIVSPLSSLTVGTIGKSATSPPISNRTIRQRILKNMRLSSLGLIGPISGCTVKYSDIFTGWNNTLEAFTGVSLYASNTDDNANPLVGANNLNNFIGIFPYGIGTTQTFSIPLALINARLGGYLSFIYGEPQELSGTGVGVVGTSILAAQGSQVEGNAALVLDWGF